VDTKADIVSKILVHEPNEDAAEQLREYFKSKGMVGLKDNSKDILELLNSNTDLGAVFLSSNADYDGLTGAQMGLKINNLRPELPLFIRKDKLAEEDVDSSSFGNFYSLNDLGRLDYLIDEHLFSRFYPIPLIRGVQEITQESLQNTISNVRVSCDPPYLVKDQLIFGELFSLIPLESNWCRGYMMLQTTEHEIMDVIQAGKTHLGTAEDLDFRDVNSLLNEITNLVWGGIKSRFFVSSEVQDASVRTQVPILVNHKEKYISFGTVEPQLCFKYQITDVNDPSISITVYQKIVFNLDWRPEAFQESDQAVDQLVDSGELELF
jgi:hypothetical protein